MGNMQATREQKFLNKEYAQRISANDALYGGDFIGARAADGRADQFAYKADRVHRKRARHGKVPAGPAEHTLHSSAPITPGHVLNNTPIPVARHMLHYPSAGFAQAAGFEQGGGIIPPGTSVMPHGTTPMVGYW
jgi:hypothetical protein